VNTAGSPAPLVPVVMGGAGALAPGGAGMVAGGGSPRL